MYAVISVESSPVVSALHKVCLKISEKGFSHQDMMRVPVTDFIDPDVAGTSPELRPRAADLASFTAGYLGRLIRTPEFQSTERVVREKVRHLSFLVHLVCRLDDFEAVYREFLSVEEVLTCGNIGWDNEGYFRDWERKTLQKVNLGFFGGKTVRDGGNNNGIEKNGQVTTDVEELKDEPGSDFEPSEEEYDPHSDNDFLEDRRPLKIELNKPKQKRIKVQENKRKVSRKAVKQEGKSKWHRYSCEDCNVHNLSFRMHSRHLFEQHEQTLCTHCGVNFEDFKVFWVHQESHKEKHICDICSNEFRSSIYLRNHKRTIHSITDDKYNNRFCQICPECGKSVDSLKQHMQLIHSPHKLRCPHCEFQTPYKNNLKNHIENKHTGGNIKNCPFCGKLVKNVKRHLLAAKCDLPEEERNNPADMVQCDRCNKQFKNLERLKKHVRDIHDKPAIQCHLCNFKTKYNCNMKMHIRRVHENKPLRETCPVCGKECVSVDWHIKTYHPTQIVL